jgi:hypothetical protein
VIAVAFNPNGFEPARQRSVILAQHIGFRSANLFGISLGVSTIVRWNATGAALRADPSKI